jgi:hypothetical protein
MLSPDAKVHLQLWSRREPTPSPTESPAFPDMAAFVSAAASGINQINGRPVATTGTVLNNGGSPRSHGDGGGDGGGGGGDDTIVGGGGDGGGDSGDLAPGREFCTAGVWTVERYNEYVTRVHQTVMTPAPPNFEDPSTPLPAGRCNG